MKLRRNARGAVLLVVFIFVLVTTLAASSMVTIYTTQTQRDKEEQLLFVGDQFRKAITSYYNTIPPGGNRSLPPSLDALLDDQRFPKPLHHLRRLYADPMTGQADWEPIREGAGIIGIRSQSDKQTIKRAEFGRGNEHFEKAHLYSEWLFVIRR